MNIRCAYCRQSFNLNQEYIAQLVHAADEARQKYAVIDCINCRKRIKTPIQQMRRYMPVAAAEEMEEETAEEKTAE